MGIHNIDSCCMTIPHNGKISGRTACRIEGKRWSTRNNQGLRHAIAEM